MLVVGSGDDVFQFFNSDVLVTSLVTCFKDLDPHQWTILVIFVCHERCHPGTAPHGALQDTAEPFLVELELAFGDRFIMPVVEDFITMFLVKFQELWLNDVTSTTLSAMTCHNPFVSGKGGQISFPDNLGGHHRSLAHRCFLCLFCHLVDGFPVIWVQAVFRVLLAKVVELVLSASDGGGDVAVWVGAS